MLSDIPSATPKRDDEELVGFARSVSVALVISGPMPHERVVRLLCMIDLDRDDAARAIRLGLARGVLVEDGANLRAGPKSAAAR